MVLEKHVVLLCRASDATEYVTFHKVVDIGTEAIDNLLS